VKPLPSVADIVDAHWDRIDWSCEGVCDLTPREREMFKHLACGRENKEIVEHVSIAFYTVKEHVSAVLKKIGVTNRAHASVIAWSLMFDPGRYRKLGETP
tara:strand:- start:9434 stop:9733 length:300 start_codon:yes stop_codon:yes gene_type:complete